MMDGDTRPHFLLEITTTDRIRVKSDNHYNKLYPLNLNPYIMYFRKCKKCITFRVFMHKLHYN
jgi:hypothetical protein